MKIIEKTCLNCDNTFKTTLTEHKRGNGKYCSRSCTANYYQKTKPKPVSNVKCAFCNKEFYKNISKINNSKSGLHFCCRDHKDRAQRLGGIKEIQPSHYGTANGKYNYRKRAMEQYGEQCQNCHYNEYVQILQVHHIDKNRDNNDLSNLKVLCPNCHELAHYNLIAL